MKKIGKPKPFDEYSGILYVDVFQQKENATKELFFDFSLFWHFFGQKTVKID